MTLIELYDRSPIENIIGILSMMPDKVYFVGAHHPMLDHVDRITQVLSARGLTIDVEIHTVDPFDLSSVRKTLTEIVEDEPHCVIDTLGGDERLLMIASELIMKYNLQAQHIHIPTGTVTDTDGDGTLVPTTAPILSVEEIITLHGGTVTACTTAPACHEEDADKLWALTCHHPREWNNNLKFLATIEKHHHRGQTVSLAPNMVSRFDRARYAAIRDKLSDRGIIRIESTPKEIRYTYVQPYMRSMLEKAGNILEHKAFFEAKRAVHRNQPLFNDVCMGVEIEWDHELPPTNKKTNNEIDLLLMHGVQPLFVSCKNGDVDENELYKLATVADRFGGEYAKKMLIVTELEPDSLQARNAIIQRAADMGIYLVPNAGRLEPHEWTAAFVKVLGLE